MDAGSVSVPRMPVILSKIRKLPLGGTPALALGALRTARAISAAVTSGSREQSRLTFARLFAVLGVAERASCLLPDDGTRDDAGIGFMANTSLGTAMTTTFTRARPSDAPRECIEDRREECT
jgi:hypothetical protein